MKICLKSGLYGAREAKGTGVIVDVFRASSTICAILAGGAKYIVPTKSLNKAFQLKRNHPDYLLIGERGGLRPEGFDLGNSPYEVSRLNLSEKIVIFTSSAGFRAIIEAQKSRADELLIGSFVNARAVADYIEQKAPDKVSLVAVGTSELGLHRKAAEDQLCAQYIRGYLYRKELDFSKILIKIQTSDGAERLRRLGQIKDLELCLKLNLYYDVVPEVIIEKDITKTPRIVWNR